jgi:primosomal protein N' (replication factor Y)
VRGILAARVAVEAARFHIDKPYDYIIPETLRDVAVCGLRVAVPFGRGNRESEGIILSLSETETMPAPMKCVSRALESKPAITEEQRKLALWMSERFFCTVFDAVHACLPAGLWLREGKAAQTQKTAKYVAPAIAPEDARMFAERRRLSAPTQSAILALLADFGEMSRSDVLYRTGATGGVLRALERRGEITIIEREFFRAPKVRATEPSGELALSGEQRAAYDILLPLMRSDKPEAALLYGVTGSGKTQVYIALIEKAIEDGGSAIVLVPEIALTPQLMSIFISRFGDKVAVLHSALTPGERFDEWRRLRSGAASVAIGTRSAVFAPLTSPKLIIIDEEQERTYKSESAPRYHAREIAKYRCVKSGGLLLLGSATPSVESMYAAERGKYHLVRMDSRYGEHGMPGVIIADMKADLQSGRGGVIGSVLEREIRENLSRGEQSILFLNRRGASPVVACPECGYTFRCDKCSVSLTYHSANGRLMCHYCGHSEPEADCCPECGGLLRRSGAGTQRAEEELSALLPGVGILRMDADTISAENSHDKILDRFRTEKIPILLGTQMVAKGLDFENVTLVGVLSADSMLYISDYRAHERTFSLITQVVGRAGRGAKPGRAVIQTMTPEHDVIRLSARQDYDGFYRQEIEARRSAAVPPVRDMFAVALSGENETAVVAASMRMRLMLDGFLRGRADAALLGPAPAQILRVNGRYRYRISVLAENNKEIRAVIACCVRDFARDARNRGVAAHADADPFE